MNLGAGNCDRVVGRDVQTVGLDQSLRLNDCRDTARGSACDSHESADLRLGFEFPTKELVDLHALFYRVETVLEVVEDLVLGRQIRAILARSPFDVSCGEHRMWLVKTDI